jgi:hypothetical protein
LVRQQFENPATVHAQIIITLLHRNDHRAIAVILYTGLASNNGCVGYTRIDKDVRERGLETIQIV